MKKLISLICLVGMLACGLPYLNAYAASGSDAWRRWLSTEERIVPIAELANKRIYDGGLDALTGSIETLIDILSNKKLANSEMETAIAEIWVFSVAAQVLQDMDPLPNKYYQSIINKGINFSIERLQIPDLKQCIILTRKALIRAAN